MTARTFPNCLLTAPSGDFRAKLAQFRQLSQIIVIMQALGVDKRTLVAYWKAEGRVHLELA